MMGFMAWIRHRLYGHYWHGDEVAKSYERAPDGTMEHTGYMVHMRCLRCGEGRRKRFSARPAPDRVVELPQAKEKLW